MLKNNYDLNVWDRLGWETEYEHEGWCISVYRIPEHGSPYGSGEFVKNIDLKPQESVALTLGVARADGGDYTPDSDFWIDAVTFFLAYREIPSRIKQEFAKIILEAK